MRIKKTSIILSMILCLASVFAPMQSFASDEGGSSKWVKPSKYDDSNAYTIFVAPDGKGDGSFERPYGTVAKALAKAETIPKDGTYSCVKIVMRGGNYMFTEPMVMTAKDSGTAETPLVITAFEGEKPVFVGAENVDVSKATKVKNKDILKQIPKEARNEIYEIDLGAQGIYGVGYVPQTYYGVYDSKPQAKIVFDGQDLVCARWPNGDEFAKVGTVYYPGIEWYGSKYNNGSGMVPSLEGLPGFVFSSDAPRVEAWGDAKDAWLYGYWRYGWAVDSTRIKTVQGNMVFTESPASFSVVRDGMYYVFNLLQEMDAPGEWYVDDDTDILYFYPTEKITEDSHMEILTYADLMFDLDNCNYVTFENLSFKNSLGGVVDANGCDYVQMFGCDFEGIQLVGVMFSDCDYSGVLSSDFYNMGSTCIEFDCNDWQNLENRNCYAVNNYIEKYAQYNTIDNGAIETGYSTGIYVAHNVIHDGPCNAIGFGGHTGIYEYNEIYDVCQTAADMGMMYSYWEYNMAGVIIRYNYLHDTKGTGLSGWTPAIYFDELSSGNTAYGNVIDNVNGALLMNGGHRNIFRNNIVLNTPTDVKEPMSLYSHAYNWGDWASKESWRGLFPVQSEAYQKKYPELYHVNEDDVYLYPYNSYFDNNVFYNGMYFIFDEETKKYVTIENNVEYQAGEDIGFVDMENKNFTLKEDSVVFRDIPEFKPIPFEDIGLYVDEYRTEIK